MLQVVIVVLDEATADEALADASLACGGCGGRLRPWGYARTRTIRGRGGTRQTVRPRRARCTTCRATHVLLPAGGLPRRTDTIEVVGAALLAYVAGKGHRAIAAELAVPAATVRGWIRRAAARAEWLRVEATLLAHAVDAEPAPSLPTGSALGDALAALGAAKAAVTRRLGPIAPPWHLATTITGGRLLAPLPTG
ncbi:DUF6431 domain-containing protein [Actinopolymorpha sp. B17G11]|uniref:DUF6431 domain-containing protein n=1 Tax=Actinopolymorpha sp. B17G11 TaxID=3160861 RepID=UPI0032E39700